MLSRKHPVSKNDPSHRVIKNQGRVSKMILSCKFPVIKPYDNRFIADKKQNSVVAVGGAVASATVSVVFDTIICCSCCYSCGCRFAVV